MRDASHQTKVMMNGLSLNVVGQGTFYIDNSDPSRVKVFSQNASLVLDLQDKDGKSMTQVYLYPHMYFVFNPARNQFIAK